MNDGQMVQHERKAPAVVYREQVERYAEDFVTTMVGAEEAEQLTRKFGLAFREAALRNSDLYEVPPIQVAWAIARSAMTGLMPGGALPEVDLIVRRGELNWQISARGWSKLAELAGWHIEAVAVMQGDTFEFRREIDPDSGAMRVHIKHEPDPWGDTTNYDRFLGFLMIATDDSGRKREPKYRLVTKHQIQDIRKKASQTKRSDSPWNLWPMQMAEKTARGYVIRRGMVPMHGDAMDKLRLATNLDDMEKPPALRTVVEEDPPPAASAPALTVVEPRDGLAGVADALDAQEDRSGQSAMPADAGRQLEEASQPPTGGGAEKKTGVSEVEQAHLDRVKALSEQMPASELNKLMKRLNDGKTIRFRRYNAKVQELEREITAWLAKDAGAEDPADDAGEAVDDEFPGDDPAAQGDAAADEELPREPGDESEEEDEPWERDEVEERVKALVPKLRQEVCTAARVPFDDFYMPVWGSIDADGLQRLGNAAEAAIQADEG